MAKITRKTQKQFGSTASGTQIAQFGSFAAGSPIYSNDPITIQALGNYLSGWFSAVIGGNSPCIEDMNALFYLAFYQLSYGFQAGVPEWDSATTYYIGSCVTDGAGKVYISLQDTNLNQAVTLSASWRNITGGSNVVAINPATQSPYTLTNADIGKTFYVNSANGAMTFNLPTPAINYNFSIQDIGNTAATNAITIHRNGGEKIMNLTNDYLMNISLGQWSVNGNGTDWFINSSTEKVAIIQYNGGGAQTTLSSSPTTVPLSAVYGDSIVSIGSNQFTLQPGIYDIEWMALMYFYRTNWFANSYIYNVTDSTEVKRGAPVRTDNYGASVNFGSFPNVGYTNLTITATKVFELRALAHDGASTLTVYVGTADAAPNDISAVIKIRKIK